MLLLSVELVIPEAAVPQQLSAASQESNCEFLLGNSYFFLLPKDNGEIMIVKLSPDDQCVWAREIYTLQQQK